MTTEEMQKQRAIVLMNWRFVGAGMFLTLFYAENMLANNHVNKVAKSALKGFVKQTRFWIKKTNRNAPPGLVAVDSEEMEEAAAKVIDLASLGLMIPDEKYEETIQEIKVLIHAKVKEAIADLKKEEAA